MRHRLIILLCLPRVLLVLVAGWSFSSPEPAESAAPALPAAQLNKAEEAEIDAMVRPVSDAWVGNFDRMPERQMVRTLVPYGKPLLHGESAPECAMRRELMSPGYLVTCAWLEPISYGVD